MKAKRSVGLSRGRSFRGTWRRIPAADPHRQAEAKDCLPSTGVITKDRPLREIFGSELGTYVVTLRQLNNLENYFNRSYRMRFDPDHEQ